MDFFGEQRIRTRRSLLLYGLFFLIVLAHMAVALAVMGLLLTVFTGGIYHWVLILVIILTLGGFVGGSFLEYRRLRAGGRAIAQRVGAVRLFIDSSQEAWEHSHGVAHQHETKEKVRYSSRHIAVRNERDFPPVYRRYYEIAQQLAIASGLSTPILYVLPDEQGINGFVAGRHSQDMVLVVTQGALDKLSDEALYGLIGHEYGHILHGDATFNLQLMVVLAGLQILYDWSDPIPNNRYFDNAVTSNIPLSQRQVDSRARSTEAQTASFTTHSEWVTYWQAQSQQKQSSAKRQSKWVQSKPVIDRQAPRSVWTLLLHGLSFSSMASAQLIKHSFNRERELLADATSVQLTRTPAIIETLKAIHQDSLGSRLSGIADINGLSHFFFASSGADLGDVSWFATHPSLTERMSAINADAYHDFAMQVAKEKRINQQKIDEIYEQRRLGGWESPAIKNSLSKNKNTKNRSLSPSSISGKKRINNHGDNPNGPTNESYIETGLEFTIETETIIDGRLQVEAGAIEAHKWVKPWQVLPNNKVPTDRLLLDTDIQNILLPDYVLTQSYHPLGALALIEAVLLCHQRCMLSTMVTYDLTDIWCEGSEPLRESERFGGICPKDDDDSSQKGNSKNQVLPHPIDGKLLEAIAALDRRLDSALIALALKHLCQHDLSLASIEQSHSKNPNRHALTIHQYSIYQQYEQQQKCRTMLIRYQQGLLELFNSHVCADVTGDIKSRIKTAEPPLPSILFLNAQKSPVLSLWQALHLQQLLPVLAQVLNDDTTENAPYQQVLQTGVHHITAQLDPSGETFKDVGTDQQMMLTIFAYRLARNALLQDEPNIDKVHYTVDLRRHARLIDIDLTIVSDANLQWLLLTAQSLNSIQLLVLIISISVANENEHKTQQDRHQIAYNVCNDKRHRLWLSTLHTVMLHDTIVSQDEYDCLIVLAERWLGVRQLLD